MNNLLSSKNIKKAEKQQSKISSLRKKFEQSLKLLSLMQNCKTQHLLGELHGSTWIWMLIVSFVALVDADKGFEEKHSFYRF